MRRLFLKKASWVTMIFFVLNLAGCGGGGSGESTNADPNGAPTSPTSPTNTTAIRQNLTNFNDALDSVYWDLASVAYSLEDLQNALLADDGSAIGLAVDDFDMTTSWLLDSIENLDAAETQIQQFSGNGPTHQIAITTIVGAALVIKGLYSFAQKMKSYSDDASEARRDKESAEVDIMNNVPGAEDRRDEAKRDLNDAGTGAAQEFTTKVATDLILSPVNPTSVTGLIIKDAGGNILQDKLKVISSTEECSSNYEDPDCKLGIVETGGTGTPVDVPSGKSSVIVSGEDYSRKVIEADLPADTDVDVNLELTPIDEATEATINNTQTVETPPEPENPPGEPTASISLSRAVSSQDSSSITYAVSAAISGVNGPTTISISVENAATGSSSTSISTDSTLFWNVTVLTQDATATITRSDTGASQSIFLPGLTANFDGTYTGSFTTTFEAENAFCYDSGGVNVSVYGTSIGGDASGSVSPSGAVSGVGPYGMVFSGSIVGMRMSGSWHDPEGGCSGTFSLSKQ